MISVRLVRGHDACPGVVRYLRVLLEEVDDEFVPRLSGRPDTVSTAPTPGGTAGSPPDLTAYLNSMRNETWLVAFDGDDVVGLLSFRAGYRDPALKTFSPSSYATTVAVDPRARRTGVGTALYDAFEQGARQDGVPYLTTRTWTTNSSHLALLRARGFRPVIALADDRGGGVGTVFLAYTIEPAHPA